MFGTRPAVMGKVLSMQKVFLMAAVGDVPDMI
jgi:hypothetical protein